MLDIVIDNQTYTYVSSVKIDNNSYIAYSDGMVIYISGFHYENDNLCFDKIDDKTFLEVKEVLGL